MARYLHNHAVHAVGGLMTLGPLAVAIAIRAYPLARRLTRRVERLQARVEELGAGDVSARVNVEGNKVWGSGWPWSATSPSTTRDTLVVILVKAVEPASK